jgi:uncharacterized membrane protein
MLKLAIVAVAAYVAWRYYGWHGAAAVICAYLLLSAVIWILTRTSANAARQEAARHMSRKLSEDEKAHLAATREHQQAMLDHKAQFDPELRKRGPA